METSAKRLKWLLSELRIRNSDLSRRLNTHPNNITNKLNRRDEITGEFALEIYRMLKGENVNINLHWLLTGEGYPFTDWKNPEMDKIQQEISQLKQQIEGCKRERDLAMKLIEKYESSNSA